MSRRWAVSSASIKLNINYYVVQFLFIQWSMTEQKLYKMYIHVQVSKWNLQVLHGAWKQLWPGIETDHRISRASCATLLCQWCHPCLYLASSLSLVLLFCRFCWCLLTAALMPTVMVGGHLSAGSTWSSACCAPAIPCYFLLFPSSGLQTVQTDFMCDSVIASYHCINSFWVLKIKWCVAF